MYVCIFLYRLYLQNVKWVVPLSGMEKMVYNPTTFCGPGTKMSGPSLQLTKSTKFDAFLHNILLELRNFSRKCQLSEQIVFHNLLLKNIAYNHAYIIICIYTYLIWYQTRWYPMMMLLSLQNLLHFLLKNNFHCNKKSLQFF